MAVNIEKLLQKAKEHFETGEVAKYTIYGAYETKSLGADTVKNGIMIATDRRVVFYGKRTFGFDLESFPYKNISSFEMGKSMMGHKISFFSSGNKVSMKWINKGDLESFISEVRNQITGNASNAAPTSTNIDEADQIKKLAELRDQGILTEEEFSAKKKQLLGI
ncbi:PH domain-containing protein [Peribacillus sp. B-H-3]|uniref:PH domain-containing protein n=1 Tax=Peribacillus sp. B-H-3 TaxID=3400420 RepID=UPI003B0259EB